MEELRPTLWTVPALARAIGVGRMTLWRLCTRGDIEAIRTPGGAHRGGRFLVPDHVARQLLAGTYTRAA